MCIVHISTKKKKGMPIRPGRTAAVFPGIDDPRYATRLVATQQPDKALHLNILVKWSLCSSKGVQTFNDKSYKLKHVVLPQELPHVNVCSKKLLIFVPQMSQRRAFKQSVPFI